MKLSDDEIRELFQRKTAREESRAADCLSEDVLIRAARGYLDSAERERVAAHIARCSDCAREFRIARGLAPLESAARREFPERRRTAWLATAASVLLAVALPALIWMILARDRDAALIEQLRSEVAELRVARPAGPPSSRLPAGDPEVQQLRTTIAELSKPQIDVPIVDLDADVTRGTTDPITTIAVPPSASIVTLILHLPEETSAPVEIEILDSDDTVVATNRVDARKGRSSITLALYKKILREGKHAIRVRSKGKKTTFHFRVDYL